MANNLVREIPLALGYKFVFGKFTFDSSYPTGGEVMDLSAYLDTVEGVVFESFAGYDFQYDKANAKVKAFRNGLHGHTLHFQTSAAANAVTAAANALRTPAAAFDVASVVDNLGEGGVVQAQASALAEVSSGIDLSTLIKVSYFAWGYKS